MKLRKVRLSEIIEEHGTCPAGRVPDRRDCIMFIHLRGIALIRNVKHVNLSS